MCRIWCRVKRAEFQQVKNHIYIKRSSREPRVQSRQVCRHPVSTQQAGAVASPVAVTQRVAESAE